MNATIHSIEELTAEQVQLRADDLRSGETYERRVRIKCIKESIAENEARQLKADADIEDRKRSIRAIEDDIDALLARKATEQAALNDAITAWGDARVAIVKAYIELADLSQQSTPANGGDGGRAA